MPIYHFTEENISICELSQTRAEKILREQFSSFDINFLCYWSGVKETFGVDFQRWNLDIRGIENRQGREPEYHKIPEDHRDFLEQFLAYYNPVIDLDVIQDLDEDDEDCI